MITLPQLDEEFLSYVADFENNKASIEKLYRAFEHGTNSIPALKQHRDYIEAHDLGYGDRAFHYMWHLLVQQMPDDFKFLEIGVYKGQVISLISLLGRIHNKRPKIVGLTPLSTAGDRYSVHDDVDYLQTINDLFAAFKLETHAVTLIHGESQNSGAYEKANDLAPYDIVYIDGCHEIDAVVSDILLYANLLRIGGFLVIDDAGALFDMPEHFYIGIDVVTLAAHAILDDNPKFAPLFACGHNRIWQKIEDTSAGVYTPQPELCREDSNTDSHPVTRTTAERAATLLP